MSLGRYAEITKLKGTGIGCTRHAVCGKGPGYKGGLVGCTLRDTGHDTPPSSTPGGPGPGGAPGILVPPTPVGGDVLLIGVVLFAPEGFDNYEEGLQCGRLIQSPQNPDRYKVLTAYDIQALAEMNKPEFLNEYEFIENWPTTFDNYMYYYAPPAKATFTEKKSVWGWNTTIEGQNEPDFHILDWRHYRVVKETLELKEFGGLYYPDPTEGGDWPHHDERIDEIEDDWSHERDTYEIIFPEDWKDEIVPDDILYIHLRLEHYTFSWFIPEPEEGEDPIPPDTPSLGKLLKKVGDGEWEEVHEVTLQNYEEEITIAYDNETVFSYEEIEGVGETPGISIGGWLTEPDSEAAQLVVTSEGQMDIFDPLNPTWADFPDKGYFNLRHNHAYLEISQLKYTRFFVMIWIDEAVSVYNNNENDTATYDADLVDFIEVMELHKSRAALMCPYDGGSWQGWDLCIPAGYSPPVISGEAMPMVNIGRPPTGQELIDLYEGWTENFEPRRVLLAVDESGSMWLGTIQPAYDELKAYLDTNVVPYEETTFENERWVALTTAKIIEWAQ